MSAWLTWSASPTRASPARWRGCSTTPAIWRAAISRPAPAGKDIFADLRKIGPTLVTGRGFAWMTDARDCDPGGSFVSIPDGDRGALGGNRFYTLEKKK